MMSSERGCRICGHEAAGKDLTNHIRREHGLKSEEYTVEHICGGTRPGCEVCGAQTRYVAFGFKRFCKACARVGSSIAGREGGRAPAWNRGATKATDARIARRAQSQTGEGNPFWGQRHSDETRQRISLTKTLRRSTVMERIQGREADFELVTPLEEYRSRQGQHLEFRCRACGTVNRKTLQAFERGSQCQRCFPVGVSQGETEVAEWLRSLGVAVRTGARDVIGPKELDIFLPEHDMAVEFNGLYWHSELAPGGVDRRGHVEKTDAARAAGVRLVHVFSDEWARKREVIESMLLHRVGASPNRLPARGLRVVVPSVGERRAFFEQSHVSGDVPASAAFALADDRGIVCCLSIRKPRQKKWSGMAEIARFATRPYHHVPGGLQRLLKRAKEQARADGLSGIITYADRRFGEGEGYARVGFEPAGDTGIDYWYTDGSARIDRFSVRAAAGLSERARAREAGLGRVWGCGSRIWMLRF